VFASFVFVHAFKADGLRRVHGDALGRKKVNAVEAGCEFHKNRPRLVAFTEHRSTSRLSLRDHS
jgi:hypothetical protein